MPAVGRSGDVCRRPIGESGESDKVYGRPMGESGESGDVYGRPMGESGESDNVYGRSISEGREVTRVHTPEDECRTCLNYGTCTIARECSSSARCKSIPSVSTSHHRCHINKYISRNYVCIVKKKSHRSADNGTRVKELMGELRDRTYLEVVPYG